MAIPGPYLPSNYRTLTQISSTDTSTVSKAIEIDSGREVVIRDITGLGVAEIGFTRLLREVEILEKLSHPAILPLLSHWVCPDPPSAIFVTEFMPNKSLREVLSGQRSGNPNPLWTPTAQSICIFGIAAAMSYLESKGIIHRDLKPANILFDADFEPRVSDFALARDETESFTKTRQIGAPLFMAPELFEMSGDDYSSEVDVYGFGVLLYSMYAEPKVLEDGKPFSSTTDLMKKVAKGMRFQRNDIPDENWRVIEACWNHSPRQRPSFESILEGWIAKEDWVFPGTDMAKLKGYMSKVTGRVFVVPVTSEPVNQRKNSRGKWGRLVLLGVLALLVVIGVVVFIFRESPPTVSAKGEPEL
jgi:serine/threonine protein kinase